MSTIDLYRHLRIGKFLGVPVYQLMEPNDSFAQGEVGAILIGGGDGEHPAIVLGDPNYCVARYLGFCMRFEPSKMDAELTAASNQHGDLTHGDLKTMEYWKWTNQDHLDFRQRCSGLYDLHRDELSFEAWLLMSIGEFLWHVIPGYNSRILSWHDKYRAEGMHCWFDAVSIPYDTYDGNGKNRLDIVDSLRPPLASH